MAVRRTHIVVSEFVVTGGIYLWNQQIPVEIVGLLGVWWGAQLPDVDLSNTKINRWLGPLGSILGLLKHRTWTHTLWAVLLMLGLAIYFPVTPYFNANNANLNYERLLFDMITVGYGLHLIEDTFSTQGVNWLYPLFNTLYRHKYKSWGYKTGGLLEQLIYLIAWLGLIILLFMMFKNAYLK